MKKGDKFVFGRQRCTITGFYVDSDLGRIVTAKDENGEKYKLFPSMITEKLIVQKPKRRKQNGT